MKKTDIKKIISAIDPTRFNSYRLFLKEVYEKLKNHYPDMNYISFSDLIGLGKCNAANLIVNGKRTLTKKGALKIVEVFSLTGERRKYFLKLVEMSQSKTTESFDHSLKELIDIKSQVLPTKLDAKQLAFYENWYNAAILEFLQVQTAESKPRWLADHLIGKVAPKKIEESLNLMQDLGLLALDKDRNLRPTQKNLSTGSEVLGLAIFSFHQQMIDLAKTALRDVPAPERDISALTLAVDSETQNLIKEEIQAFRKRLLTLSEKSKNKDRVLQLNFQMFPITKTPKRSR